MMDADLDKLVTFSRSCINNWDPVLVEESSLSANKNVEENDVIGISGVNICIERLICPQSEGSRESQDSLKV